MSTVLVFVVVPAAFIIIVASLVLGVGAKGKASRRYRPGRPYDFRPIWFLSAPERVSGTHSAPAVGGHSAAAIGGHSPAAIGGHSAPAIAGLDRPSLVSGTTEDSAGERVLAGRTGGASDRW